MFDEANSVANRSEIKIDILFGEARQHGVGYFGFSSDETERARQIETLNEMRDTTRLERDKVRQMRRLPPLPASPDTSSSDEDKAEHEADVARTQSMVSDLVARKLEEIRRANKTREWDVGKDGQMSQEEWVEKQRAQRRAEFAPPESLIGLIGEEGKVGGQRASAPRERSIGGEAHEEEKFGGPRGFAPRERSISGEGEPPEARRSREARSGEFEDASRTSAEQMLARMEAEEAYSAGSIFCFKRKWAERNKQVFKRYQRTEGQSGGETTSIGDSGKKCDRSGGRSFPKYEGRSDSRKPVTYPLVDTRFVANKDVFVKVEKPCANSDEGKYNNKRENTDNTCKRENIDERRKSSSSMSKSQNNDERKNSDNIKNTIESVGPLIPIIPEDNEEDLIGPPIPKHIEAIIESSIPNAPNDENEELIGPPIPKDIEATIEPSIPNAPKESKDNEEKLIGPSIPKDIEAIIESSIPNAPNEELIGPPIPKDIEATIEPSVPNAPKESIDKNEDLIGPPIPAEFSKPTPTPKPTTPKTTITPALKTTTTTTTKPPLVPKAKPLVPTSQRFPWRYQKLSISSSPSTVAKTDSAKTDSTKTDSIKTDSVKTDSMKTDSAKTDSVKTDSTKTDSVKTDSIKTDSIKTDSIKTDSVKTDSIKTDSMKTDSAKTDSVKTSSPSNPETTEMRNNDSTDKLNPSDKLDSDLTDELKSSDSTEKLESRGSNERLKSSESTNEPNCDVGALIGEKQNSSDSIGEKQNSSDTFDESIGDSTGGPSTNFNFINAKNKATSLKRKLDRSNVEFDATGRIVSKTRFRSQPNTPEPFRSQSITPEANPGNGRSTKGVEIAPPSTFEYFGPSRAGFGLSRVGSKRGRAGNRMMDASTKQELGKGKE
ncbi:hypothetical protein M8J75_007425 [Diaphorina citri]|nr:hypothetical protein M8J75_007425 [Diaphorina citri]